MNREQIQKIVGLIPYDDCLEPLRSLFNYLSGINQAELENGSEIELWLSVLGEKIRKVEKEMLADM